MPVRLLKPYGGQAAGTLYWAADQTTLRATGLADDYIELASDYGKGERLTTSATAIISQNATTYRMNSATAQTLTLNPTGFFPKGTVLTVVQEGAGATTVVAGPGVTINTALTGLVTQGVNKIAQLVKGAGETWAAVGALGT